MKPKYHSAKTILAPLNHLKGQGINVAQVLSGTGLSLSILNQPEQHVSLSQELLFLRNLRNATGNPAIGLEVGACYHLSLFGIYGYALMSAASMGDALHLAYQYVELSFAFYEHSMETRGNQIAMVMGSDDYRHEDYAMLNEREMMATLMILRGLLGDQFRLSEATLMHSPQANRQYYEDYFKCPVSFNAEKNALIFDNTVLNTPLLQCDSDTASVCIGRCESLKANLSESYDIVDEVRELLLVRPGIFPTIDEAAVKLNMSGRTLRRRLKCQGSGFQSIVDNFRFEISQEYLLSTKIAIEQISVLLGYSDPAHFSHAFKRWSGVSPRSFRQGDGQISA